MFNDAANRISETWPLLLIGIRKSIFGQRRGDEVGMNRKASIRAGDQKMVWTEPQALPWLWALHGRPRICWAVRPAHEGGIGGY